MIRRFIKRLFISILIFIAIILFFFFINKKTVLLVYHGEGDATSYNFEEILSPYNLSTLEIDSDLDNLDRCLSYLEKSDAVIFAGGKDFDPALYGSENYDLIEDYDSKEDQADLKILERALEKDMPILGICRGMQLINIYFAGSLYEDLPNQFSKEIKHRQAKDKFSYHKVNIKEGSFLYELADYNPTFEVNSFHHQGIKDLGDGLEDAAWSDDGLIEAVEGRDYNFLLGLQRHPEVDYGNSYFSQKIFESFVESIKWEGK